MQRCLRNTSQERQFIAAVGFLVLSIDGEKEWNVVHELAGS